MSTMIMVVPEAVVLVVLAERLVVEREVPLPVPVRP